MKAFILVALVASVAARSLDLETLRLVSQKEKTLGGLTTPKVQLVDDDLLKEQLKKDVIVGQQKQVLDTQQILPFQQQQEVYNYDINNVVDYDRVLSIQELYTTQLFKEYLTLPLFRQYIQYPTFQRFLGSVYFQRFWQLPAYKQYFVNPVLFYKYVYPIVQLFNNQYNVPTTQYYGQQEDVLGLQQLVDNVVFKNKNFLPYAYNYNRYDVPTTDNVNYKFLLEKLYKTLYTNKPVTEVKTDVKLIPTEKVVVEPFTNKVVVEEPKIVDVQVDSKIIPVDTIVPFTTDAQVVAPITITERDVLLLKELLRQNIITSEVYQAIIYGKINFTTVLRQVITRRVTSYLYQQIINRLQVIDTVVPTTDITSTVVLPEHHIVILKDLLQKDFITPEVYQAVLYGKIDFVTLLRQVLERRGVTTDLINLIINRLVVLDTTTVVPVVTEQDVYLVKELLRQHIITPEVYQTVLVGKVDLFTLLRQVIVRRDVIDTIVPTTFDFDTTVVLTEKNIVLLKELLRQNVISQDIYQAVLVGKVDFVTILRQVLERRGITTDLIHLIINRLVKVDSVVPVTTEQDFVLLKELLRQNIISTEIYQAVIYGKIDFYTVLRQIVLRREVVDTVVPYTSDVYNRFSGKQDRYFDLINKFYGSKNLYNTE